MARIYEFPGASYDHWKTTEPPPMEPDPPDICLVCDGEGLVYDEDPFGGICSACAGNGIVCPRCESYLMPEGYCSRGCNDRDDFDPDDLHERRRLE